MRTVRPSSDTQLFFVDIFSILINIGNLKLLIWEIKIYNLPGRTTLSFVALFVAHSMKNATKLTVFKDSDEFPQEMLFA